MPEPTTVSGAPAPAVTPPVTPPAPPPQDVNVLQAMIDGAGKGTTPGQTPETTPGQVQGTQPADGVKFDQTLVDKLPQEARAAFDAARASLNGDYTQKTQAIAELRKQLETQLNVPAGDAINGMISRASSPEEIVNVISQLSQNPAFTQGLGTFLERKGVGTGSGNGQAKPAQISQDIWEQMSDPERAAVTQTPQADPQTRQHLAALTSKLSTIQRDLEHERLGSKYQGLYDRKSVDDIYAEFEKGRVLTLDEMFWIKNRDMMQNGAFKAGAEGRQMDVTQKLNATTVSTTTSAGSEGAQDAPKQNSGESHFDFIHRIADNVKRRMAGAQPARPAAPPLTAIPPTAAPGAPA